MAGIKKKMKNRTIAVLAGLGVAVLGGGIAFAYFTGVGSGSGTATVGSNNPIVVNQAGPLTAMGPGISAQALSGTWTNANSGPVYVGSLSAAVTATKATGAPAGTCDATDFAITGGNGDAPNTAFTTKIGREIAVGTGVGTWSGLSLAFVNKATNQDACKNASVTITYTANAT